MSDSTFTCPRCFAEAPIRPGVQFCPHCGLAGAKEAALDAAPLEVTSGGRTYQVLDRIAVGSVCTVYRCRFTAGRRQVEGVFKVARDARSNGLVANEAQVLRLLHGAADAGQMTPFLPAVDATVSVGTGGPGGARTANVLRMHEAVRSPDELYALSEVSRHCPSGLDGRDVAWIWRRLLGVLGFVHGNGFVHAAVVPDHVLIEPKEHKLVLVDWCCAAPWRGERTGAVAGVRRAGAQHSVIPGHYLHWYRRQGGLRQAATPGLDIGLGARCMVQLLGGDPLLPEFPRAVDPALRRYFERCVDAGSSGTRADAWKLLDDFDRLIDVLWGPRQFRPMTLPPKATPAVRT